MRVRDAIVVVLAVAGVGSLACGGARAPQEQVRAATTQDPALVACTGCHGEPAQGNAAPPHSVRGATDTASPEVGAHQAHLHDGRIRQAISCSECHLVPRTMTDAGHIDGARASLVWGPLATAAGVSSTYDPIRATCTNYCHGPSVSAGGTVHAPSWTKVDGSQAGCGTCHGIPPPPPHPLAANITGCAKCHPGTIAPSGVIDVDGGRHINGVVELVEGGSCTSCHGDATRTPAEIAAAPPRDTRGNTDPSAPGVGAHQAHLVGGALRAALACSDCHVVPGDLAHASQPLNLTWGVLATQDGAASSFDAAALTCTNYCHGATLTGGSISRPTWTGGSAQTTCGTCHGLPPTSGKHALHAVFDCASCHAGYSRSSVKPAVHVNGVADVGGPETGITSWTDPTCVATCHLSQSQSW